MGRACRVLEGPRSRTIVRHCRPDPVHEGDRAESAPMANRLVVARRTETCVLRADGARVVLPPFKDSPKVIHILILRTQ